MSALFRLLAIVSSRKAEASMTASMHRKDFLSLLASVPTLGAFGLFASPAKAADEPVGQQANLGDAVKAAEFADRVFDDTARMFCGALSYIGDRLQLFKAIEQLGKCTPKQLSQAVNCNERLITEWLRAMMAYGYVEYLPEPGLYRLSSEQAAVLADEKSPFFMGGMLEITVPLVMATHKVMEAFRTGVPITPDVFHVNLWEGLDRDGATVYQHRLVQEWLPAMSGVISKLEAGGTAADVGCGQGNAVLVLARAFPKAKFYGYDPYRPSIEKARQAAHAADLSERTEFAVGTAADLPAGKFDLATSFLTVHHMSDAVRDLASIRRALRPEGSYLIREDNLANELQEQITPSARLAYGASTLYCLHDSMANDGAALGPPTEARISRLVKQAGFSQIRKLPIESAFDALYEARV